MFLIIIKISITILILAIGMTATKDEIVYLWRRPVLFLKSVIAMYLVMPAVAALMMRILDLPHRTEVALVVLSICAGAPLLPKKLIELGGHPDYVFSLIITTSMLAIVTVPASLYILAKAIGLETAAISPAHVARVLLRPFLLPLALGMLFRFVLPSFAERIGIPMLKIGSAVFGITILTALATRYRLVLEVDPASILAFATFTMVAIGAGHLLGGPEPANRNALAVASASRHIGLALLIAANARGPHTLPLVAAYLTASTVVIIVYVKWVKRTRKVSSGGGLS
jgi:bile acid:Na+ symporter, BASS family